MRYRIIDVIQPQAQTANVATEPEKVYSSDIDVYNYYIDEEYASIDDALKVIENKIGKVKAYKVINSVNFQFQMQDLRTISVEVLPYRLVIKRVD